MERDWKTGADARDSGDGPAIREGLGTSQETRQRKLILIVGDETMLQVKSRQGARPPEIERIDGIGNARSLVDRLAERIRGRKIQSGSGAPNTCLERVVIGVADAALIIVVVKVRTERAAGAVDYLS